MTCGVGKFRWPATDLKEALSGMRFCLCANSYRTASSNRGRLKGFWKVWRAPRNFATSKPFCSPPAPDMAITFGVEELPGQGQEHVQPIHHRHEHVDDD